MSQDWKARLAAEQAAEERRKGQRKKVVLTSSIQTLQPGDVVYYRPRKADQPYALQRAQVVRPPRIDVQAPTIRVRFSDGQELTVPAQVVSRDPGRGQDPPYLTDARSRPAWKRLLRELGEGMVDGAEMRARQLAGMVTAGGSDVQAKAQAARVLLEAAQAEVIAAAARQAQRGGRGPVERPDLPAPTREADVARLDQEARALINTIAQCIHRRYFLSDADLRDLTDDDRGDREQAEIHRVLRGIIRLGEREVGLSMGSGGGPRKGNELAGKLHDSLTTAYPLALEACQHLMAGDVEHARILAGLVEEKRLTYLAANAELKRHRVQAHTGRFFHGDILSVREMDEAGGMTQYYARLTVIYGEDGHTLEIANAAEIEALTGLKVGQQGWTSLCRWMLDLSERANGRRQGRRQSDDGHLIYREHHGHLERRESLDAYPNILRAFEGIRQALMVGFRHSGISRGEIPAHKPGPGYHGAL